MFNLHIDLSVKATSVTSSKLTLRLQRFQTTTNTTVCDLSLKRTKKNNNYIVVSMYVPTRPPCLWLPNHDITESTHPQPTISYWEMAQWMCVWLCNTMCVLYLSVMFLHHMCNFVLKIGSIIQFFLHFCPSQWSQVVTENPLNPRRQQVDLSRETLLPASLLQLPPPPLIPHLTPVYCHCLKLWSEPWALSR